MSGVGVFLIDDAGRRSHLAGRARERPDGKVYHVPWHDNTTSWVPEHDLEQVAAEADDVFSLLKDKRSGRLNDLPRNLTFVHLSGRLANVVYSMDTTNTDFYAYQYKPVLTFLESPAGEILIADEVGLGKTIEAGLIWTELRARYDARRLVVVCPAMLHEKLPMACPRAGIEDDHALKSIGSCPAVSRRAAAALRAEAHDRGQRPVPAPHGLRQSAPFNVELYRNAVRACGERPSA